MNAPQSAQQQDKSILLTDLIAPAPAAALSATLDYANAPGEGEPLPELWHWLYFWPLVAQSDLGIDGHPKKGNFMPDLGLPRRMWAGGRLRFHSLLEIGKPAMRTSRILEVKEKSGRSGRLAFVTVKHELLDARGLAIEEEQDIVYREPPQGVSQPSPATAAPRDAAWSRQIGPTETMLFRYSALTFNSHRIHYDRAYASNVEGYPNLVVHGPLVATLLVDLLRRNLPYVSIESFSFKAVSPTFLGSTFTVCGNPSVDGKSVELWSQNEGGGLTMTAHANLA